MAAERDAAVAALQTALANDSSRTSQGYWTQSWLRLRANRLGVPAGAVLAVLSAVALAAPLVSHFVTHTTPSHQDLEHLFGGFTWQHPVGTDELGRDVLTRIVYGARVSLGVGFVTVVLYVIIGGAVGMTTGFYGGLVDHLLMRLVDALLSIPSIYLLILLTSLLPLAIGPPRHPWVVIAHNPLSLSIVIAVTVWGGVARLVRGEVLSLKQRDFILATRSLGATDLRLMVRHLFPNILPVVIVAGSLGVGQIILIEAALDFIGLGLQPPTPTWGAMLNDAQGYFYQAPMLVLIPGFFITLTVMSVNVFGNAVRDAFDPRIR